MSISDPPHYTTARDNHRVHVCNMAGHTKYWLNKDANLWNCERCHPPKKDVALAMIWEIIPQGDPQGL